MPGIILGPGVKWGTKQKKKSLPKGTYILVMVTENKISNKFSISEGGMSKEANTGEKETAFPYWNTKRNLVFSDCRSDTV